MDCESDSWSHYFLMTNTQKCEGFLKIQCTTFVIWLKLTMYLHGNHDKMQDSIGAITLRSYFPSLNAYEVKPRSTALLLTTTAISLRRIVNWLGSLKLRFFNLFQLFKWIKCHTEQIRNKIFGKWKQGLLHMILLIMQLNNKMTACSFV